MKNVAYAGLAILAFILFRFPLPASAHSTQYAGSVSVTLHNEPSDHPTVKIPQQFLFIFNDSQSQFNVMKCNCTTQLTGPQTDYAARLTPRTDQSASFGTVFGEAGTYTITLYAQPISGHTFAPFKASYTVTVSPATSPQQHLVADTYIQLLALLSALLIVLLLIYQAASKRSKNIQSRY
jgi:hypothetical protein